ncbi:hypothetical protein K3495_g8952 [Podosphaera aphanis]|nr:hypothetical protein K3495_g8952 [Podosphaera aphanis]
MDHSWFPRFPQLSGSEKGEWKLDVISLLAVIGESAMDSHIQVLTSSWYCMLPRILPAPQALLKPSRFIRMPQVNALVVGVHNGTLIQTLNYFPEILHPIEDLPAFTFKVLRITHREEKMNKNRDWDLLTNNTKPRESTDPIILESGISPPKRQSTFQNLKRIVTSTDERPRISARKCSILSIVTILSFIWTCGLIIWARYLQDGVAILALGSISMVSSVVGFASWWQPVLQSRPSKAKVPAGDVVIRTREGAFLLVKCNEDVARELYTGTEECEYYVNTRVYRVLVGFGTLLLMISVVLLGNCSIGMQGAIGLSYMVLNGIFWAASLIDRKKFWNLSIYQVEDVTPDDCKDAHLPQSNGSEDLEMKPSFTRTMWYAIRETQKIGWVKRGGAAPKTSEWDEWLRQAEQNSLAGNRDWPAVKMRDNVVGSGISGQYVASHEEATQEQVPAFEVPLEPREPRH